MDTSTFLQERIRVIGERIRERHPRLVVMYGLKQRPSYEQIAEAMFSREPDPFFCKGPTLLAMTPHPVSRMKVDNKYVGNDYWIELGKKLREHHCISS